MKRWLSRYLSVLTIVPVLVLIIFIAVDVVRAYGHLTDANETAEDAALVTVTSELVKELQIERGMAAGFIGSEGTKFASKLARQRKNTDEEIQSLRQFMQNNSFSDYTNQSIATLQQNLTKISSIRQKIDSLSISLADALAFYTGNNLIVLDLNGHMAAEMEETTSAERFLTLYNVAFAKEQAGIERAVLTNVFANDSFTHDILSNFISLVTKQDTYIKSAQSVATKEFNIILNAFIQSKESREVSRYRDIALSKNSGFNQDSSHWFDAATARINKLKTVEEVLLEETTEYAASKAKTKTLIILLEGSILILSILLGYAVNSTVKLRAQQSAEIRRIMEKVNAEKDLTDSVEVISEDDLGLIAKLMNLTFTNIRDDLIKFQYDAHQIGEAALEGASATEQSKANLQALQLDISSIASATEEMSVSIRTVMDNMLVASDSAKSAANETINGEEAVKASVLGISQTAEEVSRVGGTISELNKRVNDILGMVDVIKSVAEQTNLLALNAAIEAARAGEQGRGFAVVADEVRSLAQRTQQSTQEISEVVDDLKNSSQNAFSNIESGNEQAKKSVVSAEKISVVLSKIVDNIKSVDDVTRVIATSTQEQSTVIDSINTNVVNIDGQARETVVGAEQLSKSSMLLSNIAHDMEERVNLYKV